MPVLDKGKVVKSDSLAAIIDHPTHAYIQQLPANALERIFSRAPTDCCEDGCSPYLNSRQALAGQDAVHSIKPKHFFTFGQRQRND